MAASFLASFLIFLATGFYELFWGKADFLQNQPMIRDLVFTMLFLNACYYYYVAAYTEMDPVQVAKLLSAKRREWCIRVLNQTALFGLWFLLHFSWECFGIGLIVVYLTYLLWDYVTWEQIKDPFFVWLDGFGLLLAIAFLLLKSKVEDATIKDHTNAFYLLGFITAAYLMVFVLGIGHCKFNPFALQYRTRPVLH
jgi:hypothetical protein